MPSKQTLLLLTIAIALPLILKTMLQNNLQSSITIGIGGDTMLGRMVNETLFERLAQGIPAYKHLWGNTLSLLHNTDLNILNLETTFTRSSDAIPKVFNFKADSAHVQALKEARIDVVSIANNHIRDFGDAGLFDTIETLKNAGIHHVGAGIDDQDARAPVVIERNGIRIGIIGATDNEPTWVAGQSKPGTNYFSIGSMGQLFQDIRALKQDVDIVIVSLHWGPNMRQRPTNDFVRAAHAMVDAGADIIHGHSAHIFQGVEVYNNALILYDTGDFIDDYRIDPELRNDQSFLFLVDVSKHGFEKLTLIPTRIDTMQVNVATGDEANEILNRMKMLSAEFDTQVDVVNGMGVVKAGEGLW